MTLDAIQLLCHCRDSQSYHWDIALPDAKTDQGVQQLVHSLNSFSELITQDQLPQFRQMQVSVYSLLQRKFISINCHILPYCHCAFLLLT